MVATYRPERSQGGVAGCATARLGGALVERDSCLVIAGEGGSAVQPVFPEGRARWEKETRRLIFNGTAYPLGSKIIVGGGGIGRNEAEFSARPDVSIPRCGAVSLFIVSM